MPGRAGGPSVVGMTTSLIDPSSAAYAGQAVYTPRMLRHYDRLVVAWSNSLVWRCPASRIVEHYDRNVGYAHLDIGPGTGYYLDHCRYPTTRPRITLLDANPAVLRYTAGRLAHLAPSTQLADVLEPVDLPAGSFVSVGMSYLLHCLPAPIEQKTHTVIDHVLPLLMRGGIIFGATIVADPELHTRAGRALLRTYNRRGIFANSEDRLDTLDRVLRDRFREVVLDVVGAVALFAVRTPLT